MAEIIFWARPYNPPGNVNPAMRQIKTVEIWRNGHFIGTICPEEDRIKVKMGGTTTIRINDGSDHSNKQKGRKRGKK